MEKIPVPGFLDEVFKILPAMIISWGFGVNKRRRVG